MNISLKNIELPEVEKSSSRAALERYLERPKQLAKTSINFNIKSYSCSQQSLLQKSLYSED
jgi:hypothetical protein